MRTHALSLRQFLEPGAAAAVRAWLAACASACLLAAPPAAPTVLAAEGESPLEVRVETVPVMRTVDARIVAVEEAVARARIPGLIQTLSVDEGDRVEAGERVARVVDPQLTARLEAARGRLTAAETADRIARRELERMRTLFREGDVSAARLDEAVQRVGETTGRLEEARGEVRRLEAYASEGDVLAPAAGPIVEVRPQVGSAVRPGDLVARIAAEPAVVRLAVPEAHLPYLRQAGTILVETDAGPVRADLTKIYPDVERGRVEADVRLPADIPATPVGRRLPVRLQVGVYDAILVPARYVRLRQGLAFVRRQDGGLTLVQLGERHDGHFVVLSGLVPGDRLVLP
jgi:RND family efflux transporter MFP subunit